MLQAAAWASDVFPTVRAQDVISFCEEASPHQGEGALLTIKTIIMPLPFLKGDVLCATKSTDGVGAAGALLGVQVAEAAQAVGELIPGCEALPRQRLLAGGAHEALPVPGLLPVRDAPGGDGLFTLNTLQGVLFLIAGHTEVLVVLRDEALGTDGLLAAVAGEAGLVPAAVFVLHLAGTWHDGLLAFLALGGVLMGVAVRAEQLVLLGSEGLVHKGALAPRAVETGLMPVSVLVGQVLAVTADGLPTLLASAGIEGLKACHAVGALLPQDVLLAKEGFFAMVTVKALGHGDSWPFSNRGAGSGDAAGGGGGGGVPGCGGRPTGWSERLPPERTPAASFDHIRRRTPPGGRPRGLCARAAARGRGGAGARGGVPAASRGPGRADPDSLCVLRPAVPGL